MRITLVFPPPADPAVPPAGIAALAAAVQESQAATVSVRDLNLEAFDSLLTKSVIQAETQRCADLLNGAPSATTARITRILSYSAEVIEQIDDAVSSLREPECFFEPARLFYAKRIIQLACELLSARFPNHRLGKYCYGKVEASLSCFEQLDELVGTDGPLHGFLRKTAAPSLTIAAVDVIGISVCYSAQLVPALILAEALKQHSPRIHVMMGGPIITWGKHILERDQRFSRWIDSFCIGEGEEHLPRWLEALAGHRSKSSVVNIVQYSDGKVSSNVDPAYRLRLNQLPTPDFKHFPLKRYFAPQPIFCLTPARGCYYNKCSFCNYAYIKLSSYRSRDARLVTADIEKILNECGMGAFCLETDVLHPTHLKQLAAAFRASKLEIRWHGVAKIDEAMNQEFFDDLASAGCVRLFMGLESGNDRILALMAKGSTVADADRILEYCHRSKIRVEAGIIVDFPTETPEERDDTYSLISRNRSALARPDLGAFRLLRGSPLAEHPELVNLEVAQSSKASWHTIELGWQDDSIALKSLAARILPLFPETAFMDVSEDILYHSAGKHERILHWRTDVSPSSGSENESLTIFVCGNKQIGTSLERLHQTLTPAVFQVAINKTTRTLYHQAFPMLRTLCSKGTFPSVLQKPTQRHQASG